MIERYRLTLNYSGLSDYEKEKIISVFTAKSAKDALNKTNKLLEQYKRKELRVYLKEFLSDPRDIETPKLIWQVILNGYCFRIIIF